MLHYIIGPLCVRLVIYIITFTTFRLVAPDNEEFLKTQLNTLFVTVFAFRRTAISHQSFSCETHPLVSLKHWTAVQQTNWSHRRGSNPLFVFTKDVCFRYHYNGELLSFLIHKLEQVKGVEPSHKRWKRFRLPLHHTCIKIGAFGGIRTRAFSLGS